MARRTITSDHVEATSLYDLFGQSAANAHRAAELLAQLLSDWPEQAERAAEVREHEHEGDRLTHAIIEQAIQQRRPPIDRTDAHALATALDDVVDYVEEVADYLGLYAIEAPMEQAQQLAALLVKATAKIATAMDLMRDQNGVRPLIAELHEIETEGDTITREALSSLFRTGIDPMVVIRWKDIFERLESALDATERVASTLEGIVIRRR